MTKIKRVILGYLGYLRVMKNRCYNAKKKPYNPFNPLTRKISFIYRKFFLYTHLMSHRQKIFLYMFVKKWVIWVIWVIWRNYAIYKQKTGYEMGYLGYKMGYSHNYAILEVKQCQNLKIY